MNQFVFLFVNWLELAYMYSVWRRLQNINQNQLNIKNELLLSTISWILFSLVYFSVNCSYLNSDPSTNRDYEIEVIRYIVLMGIILRNLCTLYATTLFTLHAVKFKEQQEYNLD